MNSSYQSVSLSVNVQLLLTVFLVVFLWALYSRLRRADFFRWWAWAWTSFAVYLACGALSMQLGSAWSPLKTVFVILLLLSGFLESLFLANFRGNGLPAAPQPPRSLPRFVSCSDFYGVTNP